jgi:hypothetical protein
MGSRSFDQWGLSPPLMPMDGDESAWGLGSWPEGTPGISAVFPGAETRTGTPSDRMELDT